MHTTLEDIRAALDSFEPTRLPKPENVKLRASVAIVLAGDSSAPSVCLIQRAERDSDRWSGQMAFPGGRGSKEDMDHRATAARETSEEVGLVLRDDMIVGELSDISLHRHGSAHEGVLSPVVYHLGGKLLAFTPEPGEVARAFWVPFNGLFDPERQVDYSFELQGHRMVFPGILHERQTIWGLTYYMLRVLAGHIGRQDELRPVEPVLR
ncbi:MAG: CoA pyrophosphatase [Myxococcota bacterium]